MTPTPSPSKAASVSQGVPTVAAWRIEHPHFGQELSFHPITEADIAAGYSMYPLYERASPEAPPLSAAVPASGGVEAVARERAEIARLVDDLALNARLERTGEKATSVGSTGAICMSIGAESMAKTIARSIRERASLPPAPTSGWEAGGEEVKPTGTVDIATLQANAIKAAYWFADVAQREAHRHSRSTFYEAADQAMIVAIQRLALAKPASEPAGGVVRERAVGLFENFVRSTACGHVVRGLISEERAAVWTREIVEDFRASLAALSAPRASGAVHLQSEQGQSP